MTKRTLTAIALATAALFAVSAFALSETYEQFGNGPAQFIMTKDEAAQWKGIKTDDAAKSFIDAFWARRGAAFKAEFDQRVKYADEHFAEGRRKGSTTDRGRVLIILGGPAKVMKTPVAITAAPRANATDLDQETADRPRARQVWTYEAGKTPNLGIPVLEVAFVDSLNSGDWKLERTRASGDYNVIFEKVNVANSTANVTQTTTTTTTTTETKTTTGPAGAVPPATLKNPAYQTAVDAQKAGTSAINRNVFAAYSELVSPTGEFFIPLELYIPKTSSLTPDSADTFFGIIEDANGKAVYSFEEPAKLATSKDEQFVDKSITLPTGRYNAYVGLAKGDTPVAIATRPLEITEVTKDATGTSKMVLSNDVHETEVAAPPKAPFAFGKLKVVPKADMAFGAKDDLWYFVEVHNPAIDTASNLPKMQMKLELSGGNLTKPISAPLTDAQPLPLSGAPGPGQYAIFSSIPLSQMTAPLKPGDYVLKMKLIDTLSKQTYNLEQSFKITG
jgi:GWxTD domain-containing protein